MAKNPNLVRNPFPPFPSSQAIGQNNIGLLAQGSAKLNLSSSAGASNGNPLAILDSTTGVGYTEIHKFPAGAIEELYLWASNRGSGNVNLTLSFGDSSFTGEVITVTLGANQGMSLVYPGVPHQSTTVYGRASSASSIAVSGFVIRSYPLRGDSETYGFFNSDQGD